MRSQKIDVNLLCILNDLLKGRTVSETAQKMGLTQPAVSIALARLRQHFGDPLFVTIGRRLEPTPFCSSLAGEIEVALESVERLTCARPDFDPGKAERRFTLACSDYVHAVLITKLIRRMAEVAPKVQLLVLLLGTGTHKLLEEGKVDFMISPLQLNAVGHPNLTLFNETYSCIAWTNNPYVGTALTADDYLHLGHVGVSLGLHPGEGEQAPPPDQPHRLKPESIVFVPTFGMLADTVVGTNYIATVHTRLAKLFAERLPLRILDVPGPVDNIVETVQWHRNKDRDAGTIWLRELMAAIAAEL